MSSVAVIFAGGTGQRMNTRTRPKQFLELHGKPIIVYTLEAFNQHSEIDGIVVVMLESYIDYTWDLVRRYALHKVKKIVPGGNSGQESIYNGLCAASEFYGENDIVLIHDGVRPLITDTIIDNCIKELEHKSAVCVAIDSTDTIYVTSDNGEILSVPNRSTLKRAQTPQCFKLSLIKKAHSLAKDDKNCLVTDDCGLIMNYDLAKVYTVKGSEINIKITYPEDIEFAKNHLE